MPRFILFFMNPLLLKSLDHLCEYHNFVLVFHHQSLLLGVHQIVFSISNTTMTPPVTGHYVVVHVVYKITITLLIQLLQTFLPIHFLVHYLTYEQIWTFYWKKLYLTQQKHLNGFSIHIPP
jgi:hypothetical protein